MKAPLLFRAIYLALLPALVGSCSGPSGAGYQRLGIVVSGEAADGTELAGLEHCLTVPLLLGSRVEETLEFDGPLSIDVAATRDDFTVTVRGRETVSVEQEADVLDTAWSHEFEVDSSEGDLYGVRLQSGCPTAETPPSP